MSDQPRETKSPTRGDQVMVETADGHRFGGRVVELKTDRNGEMLAVLRLDTGWQVSYPISMLRTVERQALE